MVEESFPLPQQDIRLGIMDAAIRRFSWFGINKTTMAEIADDLAIPRHVLATYYPEKANLVAAVEEKVLTEYLEGLQNLLSAAADVESGLLNMVEWRLHYFEKYYRFVSHIERNDFHKWSQRLDETINRLKQEELFILCGFLKLYTSEAERFAAVSQHSISAYEHSFKYSRPIPSAEDFKELLGREQEFMRVLAEAIS